MNHYPVAEGPIDTTFLCACGDYEAFDVDVLLGRDDECEHGYYMKGCQPCEWRRSEIGQ